MTFCIEDNITLLPKYLYRFIAKICLSSHILTLSQTTNFRLFQIERASRQQFQT